MEAVLFSTDISTSVENPLPARLWSGRGPAIIALRGGLFKPFFRGKRVLGFASGGFARAARRGAFAPGVKSPKRAPDGPFPARPDRPESPNFRDSLIDRSRTALFGLALESSSRKAETIVCYQGPGERRRRVLRSVVGVPKNMPTISFLTRAASS